MSRKSLAGMFLSICLAAWPLVAAAEPIAFEQAANVTGLGGIEIGGDFNYAYQNIQQNGVTVNEKTLAEVPVFLRLGLPGIEGKLTLPYANLKSNIPNFQESNFTGLENIGAQLKLGLMTMPVFHLALGASTVFPTSHSQRYLTTGLDVFPFAAADLDLALVKLHANLGYAYRGEYDNANPDGSTVKIKPGDDVKYALGVELPAGDVLSLHAELLADSYRAATSSGLEIPDTAVTTYAFVPGVRLNFGPLKFKLGYQIPLEKKEDRDRIGNFAPTADWRVLAGASLLFSTREPSLRP